MNTIPQQRQQRRQRCPIRHGGRRPGLARRSLGLCYILFYILFNILFIYHFTFALFICKCFQSHSFKQNMETKIAMSKFFVHKTTLLDTHRHFRLAIENAMEMYIVCRGDQVLNISFKKKHVRIRSLCFFVKTIIRKQCSDPLCKKSRAIECTSQN